jgi:hypothetical protein
MFILPSHIRDDCNSSMSWLANLCHHLCTSKEEGEGLMQVHAVDSLQRTPLELACSHGNFMAVRALCKHGAQASEKALLEAVSTRDSYSRASIVRFLLESAGMEATIQGSSASAIVNHAVAEGPSDAAALILQRQKAKGTTTQVADKSWLAAAEYVSHDDPLLRFFPLNIPATAKALGKAWQTRQQQSRGNESSTQGAFSDDGQDAGQYQQLLDSTATDLLRRVCKGGLILCAAAC